MLRQDEKRELLQIAREAIACSLSRTTFRLPVPKTPGLSELQGAFVTLRVDEELRGCIGYIESKKPLIDVVAEVAVKAASEDPRFSPLTPEEFSRTTIEVSVLSPLHRIFSVGEIHIGVHGIVVAQGLRRGLLLPQVALEHGFDAESFLTATFRKSGIYSPTLFASDVEVFVFEAEVVHETDSPVGFEPEGAQ